MEQDVARSSPSRMLRVTLLADEWGSSKGGLSTINRELAKQLAKHLNVEVTFFVPKCSDEDRKSVENLGIKVLEAKERPGYDAVDWLAFPPNDLSIDVVVGHGVKLGRQAQIIRESLNCKWVQVVHIAPEELAMYKDYSGAITKGTDKHKAEIDLCKIADFVVAVGPKLADNFSAYLRSCKKEVFDLTPSIFNEFTHLEQAPYDGNKFRVVVLGRGDPEDFELKGYDIAAQAVAQLKDPNYHLIFVGAPSGKEDDVKKKLLKHGISQSQLIVRSFCESREKLANLFCEADLVIMPSRTEGFGLTALEALSAGLPILVCHNSGFGEALRKVPFGPSCIVGSEDAKVWAEEIKRVQQKDRECRLEESQELRTRYAKKFNWQKQCETIVEKLLNMVHARVKVRIDCEAIATPGPQGADLVLTPEAHCAGSCETQQIPMAPRQLQVAGTGISQGENLSYQPLLSTQRILNLIAQMKLQETKNTDGFVEYMEQVKQVIVLDIQEGSLLITVECSSLEILEGLWEDYTSGHLNDVAQELLVTREILKELGLTSVKLKVTIFKEEYEACKQYFLQSGEDREERHPTADQEPPGTKSSDDLTPLDKESSSAISDDQCLGEDREERHPTADQEPPGRKSSDDLTPLDIEAISDDQRLDTVPTPEEHHAGYNETQQIPLPPRQLQVAGTGSFQLENVSYQSFPSTQQIINLFAERYLRENQPLDAFVGNMEQVRKVMVVSTEKERFLIGTMIEALLALELERARALTDLMSAQYSLKGLQTSNRLELADIERIMYNENSTSICLYISFFFERMRFWIIKANKEVLFKEINKDALVGTPYYHKSSSKAECQSQAEEKHVTYRLLEENQEEEQQEPALRLLYKMIISPVADVLEGSEIIICPDASLYQVPFAALLDEDDMYLSEKFRIRLIPSLTTLQLIQDSPADYHSQTGALIVGDPDVGQSDICPLPGANEEAEMIGRLLHVQPLIGAEATKQAVLQSMCSVSLIHIAAHGDAKRGEIALAPLRPINGTPQKEDFMLTMSDVSEVQLRAKLVVLSCCHTVRWGVRADGVIGIAHAFLGSGARSVLVSLWAVNDRATKEFMREFYEHLSRGESVSECLQETMKWMRRHPQYCAVREWAPFVLIGDDVTFNFEELTRDQQSNNK